MPIDRPWYSDGDSVVLPAKGHLLPGHLLVCSGKHIPNLLSAPPRLRRRLRRFVGEIQAQVDLAFGSDSFAFEHGFVGGSGRDLGCSIDHIHVHVMPLPASILAKAATWLDGFADVDDPRIDATRYVQARVGRHGSWRISTPDLVPIHRHFLKLLDVELGNTARYDEDVVSSDDLIHLTFERLGVRLEPEVHGLEAQAR
jgi:diadenosine tetraphosphate (Ap4A) HIT family hydrolase